MSAPAPELVRHIDRRVQALINNVTRYARKQEEADPDTAWRIALYTLTRADLEKIIGRRVRTSASARARVKKYVDVYEASRDEGGHRHLDELLDALNELDAVRRPREVPVVYIAHQHSRLEFRHDPWEE